MPCVQFYHDEVVFFFIILFVKLHEFLPHPSLTSCFCVLTLKYLRREPQEDQPADERFFLFVLQDAAADGNEICSPGIR